MKVDVERLPGIRDKVSQLYQSANQAKDAASNLKAPEGDEIMPGDVNDDKPKNAINEVLLGIIDLKDLLGTVAERWQAVEDMNEGIASGVDGEIKLGIKFGVSGDSSTSDVGLEARTICCR